MDTGIRISLPGYDAKTCTPEQCAVDSNFDTFKIDNTADPEHFNLVTVNFNHDPPLGVQTTLFSFNHGYNHRPFCMSIIDAGSNLSGRLTVGRYYLVGGRIDSYLEAYVTDTQFVVDIILKGSTVVGESFAIRYYICSEDGD